MITPYEITYSTGQIQYLHVPADLNTPINVINASELARVWFEAIGNEENAQIHVTMI